MEQNKLQNYNTILHKRLILFSVLFSLVIVVIIMGIVQTAYHENHLPDYVKDKVVFEGYNVNENLAYQDIEEKINETNDHVRLVIQTNLEIVSPSEGDEIDLNITNEEVKAFRDKWRKEGADAYWQENIDISNTLDLSSYQEVYQAKYSPFLSLSVDNDIFTKDHCQLLSYIAQSDDVDTIYVQSDIEQPKHALLTDAYRSTGMFEENVETAGYEGRGVNIGIMESGVVDKNNENFEYCNLVVRNAFLYFETTTMHATTVASIAGGDIGVAREASIYSVEWSGDPINETEWLYDNDVDVINISAGETDGVYNSFSLFFDYMAHSYGISFIAAAGNEGETTGLVSQPSMGKNVISVGGCDRNCTTTTLFTSYLTTNGDCKPNLVAPAGGYTVPNCESAVGTSFAAPFVTGYAAILMEAMPGLKISPMELMTILQASAKEIGTENTNIYGFYNKYGAGAVNISRALQIVEEGQINQKYSAENGAVGNLFNRRFYFTKGETIRISVAWSVRPNSKKASVSSVVTNRYIIRFRDSNENIISNTVMGNTNYGITNKYIIKFTAPSNGYYYFQVYRPVTNTTPDFLAYSYLRFSPTENA